MVATPLPAEPPSLTQAEECAGVFRSKKAWHRALEYSDRLPDAARRKLGPSCCAFIEGYPQPISFQPFSAYQAYGRKWFKEPRVSIKDTLDLMRKAYIEASRAHERSREVDLWFQSVAKEDCGQALKYLEWLIIIETMSKEWLHLEQSMPDPQVRRRHHLDLRRRHLDFLQKRIGKPLKGISRAGL